MQLRSVHSRGVPLNSVQVCLLFLEEGKKKGGKVPLLPGDGMSALSIFLLASCSVWISEAQTELKRVAEENVTLPCHHHLGLLEQRSLDIEWLRHVSETVQKAVITYSGGRVYDDLNEEQKGRVSFTSNFLAGDASLKIISLQSSDAGKYICKVKNAGQYEWAHVTLKVVEKPSKPKCWLEGELLEGKELSLQCRSASGTAPISYRWQRLSEDEERAEHLPPTSRVMVRLTIRRKEKKRYEEEEAPNEIREDAEAPKAHLVKPSSSSSGSRSSRSGSSSTRSTANSASRSQRTLSTEATPHLTPPQYSQKEMEGRETEPKKVDYANLMKMGATLVMVPAQSRAFQTV
ncbi:CXADR-like membrane protein isoform X2 [Rhea pennata]|uniref:CXADR-like membrane protein isoform X2 n=1 Tax=Rhea pennata TaxID=8795 RepID=UPI002E276979